MPPARSGLPLECLTSCRLADVERTSLISIGQQHCRIQRRSRKSRENYWPLQFFHTPRQSPPIHLPRNQHGGEQGQPENVADGETHGLIARQA